VARKRPTASNAPRPVLICLDGGVPDDAISRLTPAEARALSRSDRLTHDQLVRHLRPDLVAAPMPPDNGVSRL
jgi:hypothetical protein